MGLEITEHFNSEECFFSVTLHKSPVGTTQTLGHKISLSEWGLGSIPREGVGAKGLVCTFRNQRVLNNTSILLPFRTSSEH